jgi:hypothetical protein
MFTNSIALLAQVMLANFNHTSLHQTVGVSYLSAAAGQSLVTESTQSLVTVDLDFVANFVQVKAGNAEA